MIAQLASPWTLGDLARSLSDRFMAAGIESARLDARLLVSHVARCSPETVLVYPERKLGRDEVRLIEQLAERRVCREPLAYLIGVKEFWSLPINVDQHTLTPRPDTETLIECVIDALGDSRRNEALSILDLGTGSGCILAALLSELPASTGLGIDASMPALEVARLNINDLGLSNRMKVMHGNWLTNVTQEFDLVVSNPPYVPADDIDSLEPEVSVHEPRTALDGGLDGLDAYRSIASGLGDVLEPGGIAAFEVGAGQAADVRKILHDSGFPNAKFFNDLSGIERVVLVTYVE